MELQTGVFIDSPVEGLEYVSGSRRGVTTSGGSFEFVAGEDISFLIGNVTLGRAAAKSIMTPLDLVEEATDEHHHAVTNIARLIQSLDTDGSIDEAIAISSATRDVLRSAGFINFDQPVEAFANDPNVKALFDALNEAGVFTDGAHSLVDGVDAVAHLSGTLAKHPVITVTSPNGKEFVVSIEPFEITWRANSSIASVDIWLSRDSGESWNDTPIALSVPNTGSFMWTVPILSSNNTKIRLRISDAANSLVFDDSNDDLTILLPMADLAAYITMSDGADSDGDYLPNELEIALGTDPNNPDSDRDGIRDYEEVMGQVFGDFENIPDLDQDGVIAALDTDDNGDGVHDGEGIDSDGDGIFNYLEINGFTYDWYTDNFALWDGVSFDAPYFKTDARQLSTDQDPYTDDQEASGKLVDVLIREPGGLPMVPAFPNIVVRLEGYDVTLNSEITYARGGSLSEGTTWSRQTTVENAFEQGINYEAGIQITGKLSAIDWAKTEWSAKLGGSSTWTWTRSSTVSIGESITQESNWQKATTSNPSTAARVKLKLKAYNFGTAAASNIRPTLTMKIGGMSILTFSPSNPIGILEPGGVYPAQDGTYWVVDKRHSMDAGSDIDLTLDELRMLESGAPLNIEVTQMDGDVMLLNEGGQWEDAGKWGEYIARCEAVSANIKLDIGDGQFIHQLVYADDSESSPVVTLGDALRWVASYKEWTGSPIITYVDSSGMPQETDLINWNFIVDKPTLLKNGIVPGNPDASADVTPTELVLGPDTTITARAPREALDLLGPDIYYAYYDFDARVVELAAADYNGIVNAFFIDEDGNQHPMNETMPGTGVFTLDLTTVNGGYEPKFNEATPEENDLYERVEVVNRDGISLVQGLYATYSPDRSATPIQINSISVTPATSTLTTSIDFDEYFPPTVEVYLANGDVEKMSKHPAFWDPDYASVWQYDYAADSLLLSDLEGAKVVAVVDTDCNVEPAPGVNGQSNCFAVMEISSDAISDGACKSGESTLSGYFTDVVLGGQIANYDVLNFDSACDLSNGLVKPVRLEEEIYWDDFGYGPEFDLVWTPLDRVSHLVADYGANQVTSMAYEDVDAGNIRGLASSTGGHNFFSWSTPVWRKTVGPNERQTWVITTSEGRYVKIRIESVSAQHWPMTTHTSSHITFSWAVYQ
ncbi:MAG: hypothetical protein QNJ05_12585 [Woeseiaceae bacterium]|nr:hypothetical protein [Woeseiaceae bacterium]